MSHPLCLTCQHSKRDNSTWHLRCHSPQLVKAGMAGLLVNFERDDYAEECRSHQDGTGKCGPQALNRQAMEDVA